MTKTIELAKEKKCGNCAAFSLKSEMLKVERSKGSNLLTEDQFSNKKITGIISLSLNNQ